MFCQEPAASGKKRSAKCSFCLRLVDLDSFETMKEKEEKTMAPQPKKKGGKTTPAQTDKKKKPQPKGK